MSKQICGIRWTPDAESVEASVYYGWIVQGLSLYSALRGCAPEVIEVFPTASWIRWVGKRGSSRRSTWTRNALSSLTLANVPKRTNQDQRDAIAAAVTARQHTKGTTQAIGEIVVPTGAL